MKTNPADFTSYRPPGVDPCRNGHDTFLTCPPETCLCLKEVEAERQATRERSGRHFLEDLPANTPVGTVKAWGTSRETNETRYPVQFGRIVSEPYEHWESL